MSTSLAGVAGRSLQSYARLAVNHPVDLGVAQDDLDIVAGFGERDGLDELGDLFVVALGLPGRNAVLASVVGRGGAFERAKLPHQARYVHHAKLNVVVRV